MSYFSELERAMTFLGEKEDTFFIGQALIYDGTAQYKTCLNVPRNKIIEPPIWENTQLGMSIGMALTGKTIISVFPRLNFLSCAMDQLSNHLDKISIYSNGEFKPKVIVRSSIGSVKPLNPQAQHRGDYTDGFKLFCPNMNIVRLDRTEDIFPAYEKAYLDDKPSLLIEWADKLNG